MEMEKQHEKIAIISNFFKKIYFNSKNNIICMNLNWSNNYCLHYLKTKI